MAPVGSQARPPMASPRGGLPRSDHCRAPRSSIRLWLENVADPFGAWQTVYGWFCEQAHKFL